MAAYRRVYDSHHLQADCQEPGSAPEPYPMLGNRVWATFLCTFRWVSQSPLSVDEELLQFQKVEQSGTQVTQFPGTF